MALEELYVPQAGDEEALKALESLAGETTEEAPETPEVKPEPQADPFEEPARSQGWVPKEEWKGRPEHWKPAKDFVEFGDKLGAVSRELNDVKAASARMFADLRRQEAENQRRQVAEFENQRQAYENKILELQNAKWDALEEGDHGKAREAETALMRLRPPAPPQIEAEPELNMAPEAVAYRAAVDKVHPDTKQLVDSGEVNLWLLEQSPVVQQAWVNPDPRFGIKVLDLFKAATGRATPKTPPPNSPVVGGKGPTNRGPVTNTYETLPDSDKKDFRYAVSMGVYKDNDADKAAFAKAWAANRKG